jgi:hypothetical protein
MTSFASGCRTPSLAFADIKKDYQCSYAGPSTTSTPSHSHCDKQSALYLFIAHLIDIAYYIDPSTCRIWSTPRTVVWKLNNARQPSTQIAGKMGIQKGSYSPFANIIPSAIRKSG